MTQIRNLHALLAFAMRDMSLVDDAHVGSCDFDKPNEVLALLLERACHRCFRRGIDRAYRSRDDQGTLPHGRIDVTRTVAGLLHTRGQLAFELEELERDTPCNRIIKRALHDVMRASDVDRHLRTRLSRYAGELGQVALVPPARWPTRIQAPRGNLAYQTALLVSELIHEQALPDLGERGRTGRLSIGEAEVAALYEAFIRGVTAYLLGPAYRVQAREPKWRVEDIDADASALLPRMRTDAHVTAPDGRTSIIECKFYEAPLQTGRHGDARRFRNSHLYQLLAYLRAESAESRPRGLLAYAHHEVQFDERFKLDGFEVRLVTINLNATWSVLRDQLAELARWVGHVQAE